MGKHRTKGTQKDDDYDYIPDATAIKKAVKEMEVMVAWAYALRRQSKVDRLQRKLDKARRKAVSQGSLIFDS